MSARIVTAARAWIGTPYVHQCCTRGAGTDCLGLIRGVWRDVIGPEPVTPPPYTKDWSEPQRAETLWNEAARYLQRAPDGPLKSGQILLFRMRDAGVAKHLGIVGQGGDLPTFIHAYSGHAVVETALSRPWRRRVVARFDYPQGET